MKKSDAVRILDALARGEDPHSGEVLSQGGVLSRPDVIRAMFLGSQALGAARQTQAVAMKKPARVVPAANGMAWTTEEDEKLRSEFVDEKKSVADIALVHERTYGAIQARLVKHGLLAPDGSAVNASCV